MRFEASRQIDVEEMDLVVAGDTPARGIEHERTRRDTRLAGEADRQRTGDHPKLELGGEPRLPPDLASRTLPAQQASVDAAALLKAARLPVRRERRWQVELAPLTRMQAWKVPEIRNGDTLGVLGYTFAGERGEAVLRAEYVWVAGGVYGLRSGPA